MSKLKDALESAAPILERELSRIQDLIEAWERHGVVDSTARDQLDRLKHGYENATVVQRVSDALEFCEDNDDDISHIENQKNRDSTYFLALALRINEFVSRLRSCVTDLESRMSDVQDSASFSDKHAAGFISSFLTGGPVPPLGDIQRKLSRALENDGYYERPPEQLLQDMIEDSYEDAHDARLFCLLFDFKTTLDGFEVHNVVPSDTGDEVPGYIGGEFHVDEYSRSKPENFVWVAFNQLGELCEEYNEEHNELTRKYGVFADIDDTEECIELKERIKQQARPIMARVVDETHDKYGEYRDRVIASVKSKQDEYDLSDDVVSAFSNHVTKNINALIKNVENEFSEETQFHNDEEWGVLRIY